MNHKISKKKLILYVLSFIIISSILFINYQNEGIIHFLFQTDTDEFVTQIESYGVLAWFIYVLFVTVEVVIAPIPSVILYTAGGIVFGVILGSILTLIGNIFGAALCYAISRYFFRDFTKRISQKSILQKFDVLTEKYGAFAVFFLRLNPFTSSDIISYLAGITKIKFIPFVLATGLGLLPLIIIQAYVGSDIISDNPILFGTFVVLSILYMVLFIAFILFNIIQSQITKIKERKLNKN